MELDHLFLFTSAPDEAAEALRGFGLAEGTPNTHPGQGTSCRRFFFRNAYLELLTVNSEEEIKSAAIAPTKLWERSQYQQTGYNPFGLCFRSDTIIFKRAGTTILPTCPKGSISMWHLIPATRQSRCFSNSPPSTPLRKIIRPTGSNPCNMKKDSARSPK